MPRSFDVSAESPATVEQVHSAFGDERYWLARLEAFGGSTALDSLSVDSGGIVTVATIQDLRHDLLPGVIARLLPRNLKILNMERWIPVADGQVNGEVTVSAPGALGSGSATALLEPAPTGSRLSFNATVEVKLPLVGGKIESYVSDQLATHIHDIQRFTTAWIAEGNRR